MKDLAINKYIIKYFIFMYQFLKLQHTHIVTVKSPHIDIPVKTPPSFVIRHSSSIELLYIVPISKYYHKNKVFR